MPQASETPENMTVVRCASRLFLLLRFATLRLGSTPGLLGSVLSLLACREWCQHPSVSSYRDRSCCRNPVGETYVAVCSPSRSCSPVRIARVCSVAQTSSSPPLNRRAGQNQCSCRHRTAFGSRRRTPAPSRSCTIRRVSHGALPLRHWREMGGEHRCGSVYISTNGFSEIRRDRLAGSSTHTTICLRPRSGFRINLRVRKVTWASDMMRVRVCRCDC